MYTCNILCNTYTSPHFRSGTSTGPPGELADGVREEAVARVHEAGHRHAHPRAGAYIWDIHIGMSILYVDVIDRILHKWHIQRL